MRNQTNNANKICKLLNIEYPILQGGMAWISDAALALAVTKAGGLGIIAAGNAPASWVREQIHIIKSNTDKAYGVNIMLLSPFAQEVAELCCQEKVPVIITGAGNPAKYIKQWKDYGAKVIPVVASCALAIIMERMGADAVVAEGLEAGGHIGQLSTMVLVPNVVKSVKIPVIAAGGIHDSKTTLAALCLGAQGVQVGTRFILATECNAHENYKKKILKAKDIDSKVTGRITGHPVRVIKSPLARKMTNLEYEENAAQTLEALGEGSLRRAVVDGDIKTGSFMAGQVASLLDKEETAKEIIEDIFNDDNLKAALSHMSSQVSLEVC